MIIFKIGTALLHQVKHDLSRPHDFAFERVGFLFCRSSIGAQDSIISIAFTYLPVADEDYVSDSSVGARIGSRAIRKAMQTSMDFGAGAFHIHAHRGLGKPRPSAVDSHELPNLIGSLSNARPRLPHGSLILSDNHASGFCRVPSTQRIRPIARIVVVGYPTQICL